MTTPSPTVNWGAPVTNGVEGAATALGALSVIVNQEPGGGDVLGSIIISGVPVGAKISDGVHSFIATAATTSVNVTAWNLSNLTIVPVNDLPFTLTATATEKSSAGVLSAPATATEAVAAAPLAPVLRPVAASGVEGSPIALNIGATLGSKAGDSNSFSSIIISAIPVGATLTDGTNTFTATTGATSVNIVGWSLTTLKITPPDAVNFTLSIAATEVSAAGVTSATTTASEPVTVKPLTPSLAPVRATGVEGSAIALSLGVAVNSLPGDTNTLSSLVVSAIPVGARLSDGTHAFVATATSNSVNIASWTLSSLTITPTDDANIALSVAAIETSVNGVVSATKTATETVIVDPKAPKLTPVAATGVEGTAIALNLGLSLTQLTGDANVLATLTVGAIPVGAVLSDGTNSFTSTTGATSVNIAAWSLATLTITPPTDASFTLTLSATEKSAQGNPSTATAANLAVKVGPVAPTLSWGAAPASGLEGSTLALGTIAYTLKGLPGDGVNSLASLVVSTIPVGATLTDGTHSFTATAASTSTSVVGWSLSKLKLTAPTAADYTLTATAQEKSSSGVLGAVATATELIDFLPPAPTLEPANVAGVEGSPIQLFLGASLNGAAGDSNSFASILVGAIPVGATLSDGVNTFTATATATSVNVATWALSSLTITPPNDSDFTLSVSASEQNPQGGVGATTTASEAVTVYPLAPTLAPVEASGPEGVPFGLNLGASVNNLPGDANTLSSLLVSALPIGTTLSDGVHTFTAVAGTTSVNVASWSGSRRREDQRRRP